MDMAVELYEQVMEVINDGNDAEIKRDKEGNLVVFSIKKVRRDKKKQKNRR